MAKKAKKVSWRTLTRKADKERSPRKASRLRKQAHELRRAERESATLNRSKRAVKATAAIAGRNLSVAKRATKGWATRRLNEIKKAGAEGGLAALATQASATQHGINRGAQAGWAESPGRGEIVGGADSQMADRLVALARKKGGKDAVQGEIATLRATAKYEGCVETDKTATKRLIEVQQILADRVVCGFIAEVDTCVAQHHGLPPAMTWNLYSFLILKIVDALNKAGYRAGGKT